MINKDRMIENFLKHVQIDSETGSEKAYSEVLVGELTALGAEIVRDNAGEKAGSDTDNLIAKFKGTKEGRSLILSAHMDTVTPGNGIVPIIEDGIIKSQGDTILAGDDKAGINAILEIIRTLKDNDIAHVDLEVVFTISEEGGLKGSRYLDYSLVESKNAFILDSGGTPGTIITSAPAQDQIKVVIKGKPAHAGVCPEEGISAIQVAAKAISNMNLLRIDEETTANVGIISGGQATNIVCPEVIIDAEARSLSVEKLNVQTKHMVECFESAIKEFDADGDITVNRPYVSFVINDDDELVKVLKDAAITCGLEPQTIPTGGGSDTNNFNAKGIKAVNIGVGMNKPHTLEENIAIDDFTKSCEFIYEAVKNFK